MGNTAEKEARKALSRLRRALEKGVRELDALEGAIRHAEGSDFPGDEYDSVRSRLATVMDFLEEEGQRLEAKILEAGGSKAPAEILSASGIDISSQAFWQGGFDVIDGMVKELEDLPIE